MKKEIEKLKGFRRWFDGYVKRGYGKKCPDFAWGCARCHTHTVKTLFDDFVEDAIVTEKWIERGKRWPVKKARHHDK